MRRIFMFSVLVLLLGLFSCGYAEGQTKQQQGMKSELYIGVYKTTDQGRVELPKEAKWNVRMCYVGINRRGKKLTEDCVCLVLNDDKRSFWPVIVKMDIPTAESLVNQLKGIQADEEESSRSKNMVSEMQCFLNTASYEITRKGKIVLPENTQWKVIRRVSSGKKETSVLLVLEEKQERKKKVRPFVCKMSVAAVSSLVSDLDQVVDTKMQLASRL